MRNACLILACGVVGAAVLVGCGRGPNVPKTVPVHGIVRLDGKPVEGAAVGFYSREPGSRASTGRTDADGRYSLSTFGINDGAIPGHNTVVISKFVPAGAQEGNAGPPAGPMSLEATRSKSVLPIRYSNPSESGLTAEVKPEGGQIDFDLTSK